ncbi:MAG: excinuclease ABC subunit UvrA [Phycisphaerales bacterium]|nr:excinuclease ABC subunit UvrA [Phycisphaerales bacterium]
MRDFRKKDGYHPARGTREGAAEVPSVKDKPGVTHERKSASGSKGRKAGAERAQTVPGGAITPARPVSVRELDTARCIRVRGAREHNLKGIDVLIPRDRLVVVTGLSGSGKSSLAFDTIFAEGQRKYMESLSAYARQFLEQLKKPDVDEIEGLPPTIAIEQRTSGHNPRSTVATSTEIYDYLRLLFARCGTPTCWAPVKEKKDGGVVERCGRPIAASSPSQITEAVSRLPEGTRLMVLAPVVRGKKGFHADVLDGLLKHGFVRARVNGSVVDIREALKNGGENPLKLGRYEKHSIDAVVDRAVVKPEGRQRLAESVETALKLGEGTVVISVEEGSGEKATWRDTVYSEKYACALHPECALGELEPRLFSFNSPFGACQTSGAGTSGGGCEGLGIVMEFDEDLVIPDPSMSLDDGAVAAWAKNGPVKAWFNRKLRRFCRDFEASYSRPVNQLTDEQRKILLYGTGPADVDLYGARFEGVIPNITEWWGSTENESVKEWLSGFMSQNPCPRCHGDRLRVEALSVFLRTGHRLPEGVTALRRRHGLNDDPHLLNIADFSKLTIDEAVKAAASLELTAEQRVIAEPILREVTARLGFLASVGLEYLSLDRKTATLSGGEAQRIRLATQVGSGLVGACYVLDEPTIGLHQRDNDRLIRTLRHLADIGNTVLVVEHDEDMIRHADHVLDIGPGPGVHGGRVVAQGTVPELCDAEASLTGQYLSGRRRIDAPAAGERRKVGEKRAVVVKGAAANNLKSIDAAFPLGGVVCVTGVSGSGKSTLVNDVLLAAAKKQLHGGRTKPGEHARITGLGQIDRVIEVDQTPIGRTPRSNPATYTGLFDDVRRVFAATKEAKIRGYEPGRFSFNVKGGRCEACQGQGVKKIEMHFLPDVFVECEVCKGTRYNRETLEVQYRGRSIAQVLGMTVEEACTFFENHPKIVRFARCLHDVGLDYITLGQPSTQLSGGEAQRIKLATELGQNATGNTLYILDEPTTGLHFEDVRKLIAVLNRLADGGNTLVVIEHNLDVIKCADWIIDLGPEGGANGGRVVACGTPEQVAASPDSHTGRYLAPLLSPR